MNYAPKNSTLDNRLAVRGQTVTIPAGLQVDTRRPEFAHLVPTHGHWHDLEAATTVPFPADLNTAYGPRGGCVYWRRIDATRVGPLDPYRGDRIFSLGEEIGARLPVE